jgi:hypothetical protein
MPCPYAKSTCVSVLVVLYKTLKTRPRPGNAIMFTYLVEQSALQYLQMFAIIDALPAIPNPISEF